VRIKKANQKAAGSQKGMSLIHIGLAHGRINRTEAGMFDQIIENPDVPGVQTEKVFLDDREFHSGLTGGFLCFANGLRSEIHTGHIVPSGRKKNPFVAATGSRDQDPSGGTKFSFFDQTNEGRSGLAQIPSGIFVEVTLIPENLVRHPSTP
jgi:hypothetical protein